MGRKTKATAYWLFWLDAKEKGYTREVVDIVWAKTPPVHRDIYKDEAKKQNKSAERPHGPHRLGLIAKTRLQLARKTILQERVENHLGDVGNSVYRELQIRSDGDFTVEEFLCAVEDIKGPDFWSAPEVEIW